MKKKQRIRNKWLTGSLLFLTLSASFPAQAARSPEVTETELLRSGEGDEAELERPGLGEKMCIRDRYIRVLLRFQSAHIHPFQAS